VITRQADPVFRRPTERMRSAPSALPIMKYLWLFGVLVLAACTPQLRVAGPDGVAPVRLDFPAMRSFAAASPGPARRPNAQIARDFSDLSFQLESGRPIPVFTRFEGPVTVAFNGPAPAHLVADLDGLLVRLRAEAGIDIRQIAGGDAAIRIELVPPRQLQRAAPGAACFVVPRVRDWAALRRNRQSPLIDWTTLPIRDRAAVFIPDDATPQEMRDCLHEELAQALGPLNDLYHLPDSVFNDDNMHAVLTGFDMLILRVTYAPELRSGMTQAEVMARVPGILERINPAGAGGAAPIAAPTTRDWTQAIITALGGTASRGVRQQAAAQAVAIGQARGWTGAHVRRVCPICFRPVADRDRPVTGLGRIQCRDPCLCGRSEPADPRRPCGATAGRLCLDRARSRGDTGPDRPCHHRGAPARKRSPDGRVDDVARRGFGPARPARGRDGTAAGQSGMGVIRVRRQGYGD
jgi:hypothetical protein